MLVIVGPTGVGKTELAVKCASMLGGEIINADSRQIYQAMDIGTAKPERGMLDVVPHHLFNLISPDERYNVQSFVRDTNKLVTEIRNRNSIPIIVGGTGQYIWAYAEQWEFKDEFKNATSDYRKTLEERLSSEGLDSLVEELIRKAPEDAQNIDIKNHVRVIRAMERLDSGLSANVPRKYRPELVKGLKIFGLTMPRSSLYRKLDTRIHKMVKSGWINEVSRLKYQGYTLDHASMSSIGYQEIYYFLEGQLTWSECLATIKSRTHRLVRTQANWFKMDDERIRWIEVKDNGIEDSAHIIVEEYNEFLSEPS
tara:strand:+ start:490 stop:1422 length:933 start_codon:yes stop_codon:yes gene_type:complete